MEEEQQIDTTLPARFRQLAASHGIDEAADDFEPFSVEDRPSGSIRRAAMGTIARQTASKVESALELVLHQDGAPRDDYDLALVFALFIYARHGGENARIVVGDVTFGDQADQALINVRIEPNARRGDFSIDVLVTLKSYGPHPHWIRTKEGPSSITVVKEAALLRKRVEDHADREQTRRALTSLGLMPVIYDADEIERDPFALARRVIDDLNRAADDAADSTD